MGVKIDNRYMVLKAIGAGGFGDVYQVFDRFTESMYAAKFLTNRNRDSALKRLMARKMFGTECETLARLDNPHIVDFFDIELAPDGTPVLIMELLRGRDLFAILSENGRLSPGVIVEIGAQVCKGLQHAHDRGFVHRDLKPQNVFIQDLDAGGQLVKILDFGLVETVDRYLARKNGKATDLVVGTPDYMSPEQCLGKAVTPRSDLFSFGVMLYQMATGRMPFTGMTPRLVMDSVVQGTRAPIPPRMEVPAWLEGLIDDLLQKDPALRPESAADVRQRLLSGQGVVAAGTGNQSVVVPSPSGGAGGAGGPGGPVVWPSAMLMPSPIAADSGPATVPGFGPPGAMNPSQLPASDDISGFSAEPSWMKMATVRDRLLGVALKVDRLPIGARRLRRGIIVSACCAAALLAGIRLYSMISAPTVSDIRHDCAGYAMTEVGVSGMVVGEMIVPLTDFTAYKLSDGKGFLWVLSGLSGPDEGSGVDIRATVLQEAAWYRACSGDDPPADCERIAGALKMTGPCALLELER